MDIYKEQVLEHWRNPRNFKKIKKPDLWAELHNPLCGDKVRVELKIRGDKISQIGFSGSGCILSQAAASILTEEIEKIKTVSKVKKLDEEKLWHLLGIEITATRKRCALLILQALKKALEKDG